MKMPVMMSLVQVHVETPGQFLRLFDCRIGPHLILLLQVGSHLDGCVRKNIILVQRQTDTIDQLPGNDRSDVYRGVFWSALSLAGATAGKQSNKD